MKSEHWFECPDKIASKKYAAICFMECIESARMHQQLECYYYQSTVGKINHIVCQEVFNTDKKLNVLLIENSVVISETYKQMLESMNFTTDIAFTGKDALALLNSEYDLILLDIDLPDLKGDQLCRHVRANFKKKNIPIVVLSIQNDILKEQYMKAGASLIVDKSISCEELAIKLLQWKIYLSSTCNIK